MLRTPHVLSILTSKSAFRHSGVQFFDIRTSKSVPNTSCFVHFHFHMCFSPQRRAFLRRENSKKCFGADVFCPFSLPNLLFATAACNFSTSELPKVLQTPHVLYIFISTCAFRHSGVHFILRRENSKKCFGADVFCPFSLPNLLFATAACNFSTSELPKVLQTPHVLYIFISTCAFRHSGVHFCDGRTAKSASELTCFVHFHFKMCFSPQRRACFRHLNFKKCSETSVF